MKDTGLPLKLDSVIEFLREKTQSKSVEIVSISRLSGGAIQQNYAIQVQISEGDWQGSHDWVLRCDADSDIGESITRQQEFLLLSHAFNQGVKVPEPLWDATKEVAGRPFFIMKQVSGVTQGPFVTNPKKFHCDRDALVADLGDQLARIHQLSDAPELSFLLPAEKTAGLERLHGYQTFLESLSESYPILELAIRQLIIAAPSTDNAVICHRDFRTGNFMLSESGLVAVLDWEFCGWSNRYEDIAWFCAPCWRFAQRNSEAGGLSDRRFFYEAYEARSGFTIDKKAVSYWELMATVRWAIIAIEQSYRHLSGLQPSIELALTGHIVPVLEQDILMMLDREYAA